jgi:hypothetical protein
MIEAYLGTSKKITTSDYTDILTWLTRNLHEECLSSAKEKQPPQIGAAVFS